jgi:hypothetical protein
MNPFLNHFVYCAEISNLPNGGSSGVVIALGIGNDVHRLRINRIRSQGNGLASAHRLSLFHDRDVTVSTPPEQGQHRDQIEGNESPAVQNQFNMQASDFGLFHPPGSFNDAQGGGVLESKLASPDGAHIGPWDIELIESPGFAMVVVENTSGQTNNYSVEIDYSFV